MLDTSIIYASNNSGDFKIVSYQNSLDVVSRKDNTIEASAKHYVFKDPEGEEVKIYNLAEFCRENRLTYCSMSQVHVGKAKHHKQWTKF